MKENSAGIANQIAEARISKGLTQTEIAAKIAERLETTYSSRQYQKIEEGKFPKYKTEIIKTIDLILDTNF